MQTKKYQNQRTSMMLVDVMVEGGNVMRMMRKVLIATLKLTHVVAEETHVGNRRKVGVLRQVLANGLSYHGMIKEYLKRTTTKQISSNLI